ncbi:hypothetical protein RB531_158 [Salmonella enterica subsp. enterica serovar Typhimurium]
MLVRWDLFAHDQMNYIYSLYLLREFFTYGSGSGFIFLYIIFLVTSDFPLDYIFIKWQHPSIFF